MVNRTLKPPVKKKIRLSKVAVTAMDIKCVGLEPTWENSYTVVDSVVDIRLITALNYYNYLYSSKDMLTEVINYAQSVISLNKEEIRRLSASIVFLPMTVASLIRCSMRGLVLSESQQQFIETKIQETVGRKRVEIIDENIEKNRLQQLEKSMPDENENDAMDEKSDIHHRTKMRANCILGVIEGEIDNIADGKVGNSKSIYDLFVAQKYPLSMINYAKDVYCKGLAELELAKSKSDPILSEGYRFIINDKKTYQSLVDFYKKILSDTDMYAESLKIARKQSRAPRVVSKEKLVSGAKYQKESTEYRLISINPTNIIGAKELWCFDSKTRKIIKYVADKSTGGALSINGSKILGYSLSESVAKTLRKPDEQLSEFMKLSKAGLKTFMKDIKTTEINPSGKLNATMLLLKVG